MHAQCCLTCGHLNHGSALFCGQCGAPLPETGSSQTSAPPGMPVDEGAWIGDDGQYKLTRRLGQGAFGATFLAHDVLHDRLCVIKRPHPAIYATPHALNTFNSEATALAALNIPGHRNIPLIYEYREDLHCLVIQYIEGQSLRAFVDQGLELVSEAQALRSMHQVCSALVYMHTRPHGPVLHGDIKLENILVDRYGHLWLIDFGLAWGGERGAPRFTGGTPGYTPPEQFQGVMEPRSDVYALTATLCAFLLRASPSLTADATVERLFKRRPDLSAGLRALIEWGLAETVAARPDAEQMLARLEVLLGEASAPPPVRRAPAARPLIGYSSELGLARDAIARERCVVLSGPHGIGKTALAARLVAELADDRPVFWHIARASAAATVRELAGFLAHHGRPAAWRKLLTLGSIAETARGGGDLASLGADVVDEVLGDLRGLRCLICLDNMLWVERSRELARLVEGLRELARAGEAGVVLTALEPPQVGGAWPTLALTGLDPASGATLLGGYPGVPAGDERARLVGCAEGNPQLLHLLGSSHRHEGACPAGSGPLERAGEATPALVALILSRLSDTELALLQAVAVLLEPGGTPGAIETLLQRAGLSAALAELEANGLLNADPGPWGPSYSVVAALQPTLYNSLDRQLRRTLHRRAASYYELDAPDLSRVVQHLERAGDHLRAARVMARIERALGRGAQLASLHTLQAQLVLARLHTSRLDPGYQTVVSWLQGEITLRLGDGQRAEALLLKAIDGAGAEEGATRAYRCATMARLYTQMGSYSLAAEWCERGLAALGPAGLPSPEAARLALIRSEVLFRQRKHEAAAAACAVGLEALPPDLAARDLEIALRHRLATIRGSQGFYAQAIDDLQALLPAAHACADPALLAAILNNLGSYCQDAGRIGEARSYHAASLPIKEQIGDVVGQVVSLLNLGRLHLAEGDPQSGLAWLCEALRRSERYSARHWQGMVLSSLGQTYLELHELEQAHEACTRAREIFAQLGDAMGVAFNAYLAGDMALARGEVETAREQGLDALVHARESRSPALIACALRVLGEAELARGRLDPALAYLDEAAAVEDQVRDPYDLALIRSAQARLEEARGGRARALAYAQEALELARAQHLPVVAAAMEALIARCA